MPASEPTPAGASSSRLCPKRDDRDGCDGLVGNGCGVGNIVTVVTAVTGKSLGGVQGGLFKGRPCWGGCPQATGATPLFPLGERKGAFDGVAVKSAFAFTFAESNKGRRTSGEKGA